jgi:hypothetical protein
MTYALVFRVSYTLATYISLLPLTLGVMLASSAELTISNALGLFCAFGSTIVFVSQNIFFKKIMPSKGEGESAAFARLTTAHSNDQSGLSTAKALSRPKLDKINLLFFSSGMAFLFMIPLWIYSDLPAIWTLWFHPENAVNTLRTLLFLLERNRPLCAKSTRVRHSLLDIARHIFDRFPNQAYRRHLSRHCLVQSDYTSRTGSRHRTHRDWVVHV